MHLDPAQLVILIVGDSNGSSLKHRYQNIIITTKQDDVLALIENTLFDLILLDLAVDNFMEFTALIKAANNSNNKTPIFAISSSFETTSKESILSFGFDDWLIKPVTAEQLNEIFDRWQTKALDYIQTILGRTSNNQHLTLTIFEKLFDELPEQLAHIKNALTDGQYDIARKITHRLNGSASFCGLTNIQQSANTLECYLLNNDFTAVNQHFLILEQYAWDLTHCQKLILANLTLNQF